MSAREFTRDILTPIHPGMKRSLTGKAERELEQEINNDSTCVVQGDGSVCSTRREDMTDAVEPPSGSEASQSPDRIHTPDEEPSWAQPWPSPSVKVDIKLDSIITLVPVSADKRTSRRRNSTTTPRPIDPTHASTLTRRRAPSQSNQAPPATSSKDVPPSGSRGYRFSTITMSSSTAPAPQPSIRRSHSSHPDITTLCQQWAFSGPANQTLTYRPDSVVKRKHSLTLSSVGASSTTSNLASTVSTKKYYIL